MSGVNNPAQSLPHSALTGVGAGDHHAAPSDISARAYHSVTQSIADNTWTAVVLNSERWDTDAIHDTSTNNSRCTAKTAGKYIISGHLSWPGNATGVRHAAIKLNGSTFLAIQEAPADGTEAVQVSTATVYDLAVNDYLELFAMQNSGGALNIEANGNYSAELSISKVLG